tara:strand:+ start:304 stop:831 length:528 start_codon:yes stop_codon:yes gene_type:complete
MTNALTNFQLADLAKKMSCVPLAGILFKDDLDEVEFEWNKGYIINMQDSVDENGKRQMGTHWTCFYCVKYPNGKTAGFYYDSYGIGPPKEVVKFCKGVLLKHNTADHQSLMDSVCGFFCLAYLYFVTRFRGRSMDLIKDSEHFCSLFHDLNTEHDFQYNEHLLAQFFKKGQIKEE